MYVENIHRHLAVAADVGDEETRALAERLVATLDAAIRLTLLSVLAAAVEEITCALAPGSVELRLRGQDPEFVVTPPAVDQRADDLREGAGEAVGAGPAASFAASEGAMSRINLRMPDSLKTRIEHAADSEGLSVNAWLVRAATAALGRGGAARPPEPQAPRGAQNYTGWAR